MTIHPADAAGHVEHKGQTYYFWGHRHRKPLENRSSMAAGVKLETVRVETDLTGEIATMRRGVSNAKRLALLRFSRPK